jgi:hypothetical protein
MNPIESIWSSKTVRIFSFAAMRLGGIIVMAILLQAIFGHIDNMGADTFWSSVFNGWFVLIMTSYAMSAILDKAKEDAGH